MFNLPIFVFVDGGLGNQLFQAAHGLSLARCFGRRVIFVSLCSGYRVARQCELNFFGFRVWVLNRYLAKFIVIFFGLLRKMRVDRWFDFFLFDRGQDLTLVGRSPLFVVGYWQCTNCYQGSLDAMRALAGNLSDTARGIYGNAIFFNSSCLAVHVRRGDYVNDPQSALRHNVCSLSYFRRAVDGVLGERGDIKSVAVFSDDPDWVRENLSFDIDTVYVESVVSHAWVDMLRMASCGHFVISNSTYSLWAALLSSNSGARVAPSYWFSDAKTSDLCLLGEEWYEVDVR